MKKLFSSIVCIFSIFIIMIPFFSLIGSAADDEGAEASDSSEVPSKLPLAAETLSTDYDSLLSYVKSFGCFDYVTDESGVEYKESNCASFSNLPKGELSGYIDGVCYYKLSSRICISFKYDNEYQFVNFLILMNGIHDEKKYERLDNYMYYVYKTQSSKSSVAGEPVANSTLNHMMIFLTDYSFGYLDYNDTGDTSVTPDKIIVSKNKKSKFCYLLVSNFMFVSDREINGLDDVKYHPVMFGSQSGDRYDIYEPKFIYKKDFSKLDDVYSIQSRNIFHDVYYPDNNKPTVYSNMKINLISGTELFGNLDLSKLIDVKLTPEFGLNMDRVYNQETGDDSYFKLEVTNNSDTNIQFTAFIVPHGAIDSSEDLPPNADKLCCIEKSLWNYITDSDYYAPLYKEVKKFFGFKNNVKLSSSRSSGDCHFILLKPGDHYEDYIYWENVKINSNVPYDFRVYVYPTKLDIPSLCVYTSESDFDDEKTFTNGFDNFSFSKIPYVQFIKSDFELDKVDTSVITDFTVDNTFKEYALYRYSRQTVFNQEFSVGSIPEFSSEVRGGNAKLTTGWKDTDNRSSNPHAVKDLSTGKQLAVNDYTNYDDMLSDVDVDLDNLNIDNVKSYVKSCSSFFKVLKTALTSFPAFIWVLICFGITALIVIGIVKAIL